MNNIEIRTIYGKIEDFENNYFFSPSISKISKRKTVGKQTFYVRRYFNGGKDFEQTMKSIAVQRTMKQVR